MKQDETKQEPNGVTASPVSREDAEQEGGVRRTLDRQMTRNPWRGGEGSRDRGLAVLFKTIVLMVLIALVGQACSDDPVLSPVVEIASDPEAPIAAAFQADSSTDRAALVAIYNATDGPNWTNNDNWATDAPLSDWYGVTMHEVDSLTGRVMKLSLGGNRLKGRIPSDIGKLSALHSLSLGRNDLIGEIPPEIGEVGSETGMALLSLAWNRLTGEIPPEIGKLRGHSYGPLRLRLDNNRLEGNIPPEIGQLTQVSSLELGNNDLSGPIPPEIGNMTARGTLSLYLSGNRLTGEIPPELGKLPMDELVIAGNYLTGPIPPEVAGSPGLRYLDLSRNALTGEIPPEIGEFGSDNNQTSVSLQLDDNCFTGQLPPEIGDVRLLYVLDLSRNCLTGAIPPEIGTLVNLETMRLSENGLTGEMPPEIGNLARLTTIELAHNFLTGVVPTSMADLRKLRTLNLAENDLCLQGPTYSEWLARPGLRVVGRIPLCEASHAAVLVQAVQSLTHPVPLVAHRDALLRVFLSSPDVEGALLPGGRATFHRDGTLVHALEIARGPGTIPATVRDWPLYASMNVELPSELVTPGLELVVEIDSVHPSIPRRIPATGRIALDVRESPGFELTVVPFILENDPDSTVLQAAEDMARDPEHPLLAMSRTLLPIQSSSVVAHAPVLTSTTDANQLLGQVGAVRAMEGGSGYWMGIRDMTSGERIRGLAWTRGWVSYSEMVGSSPSRMGRG